MLQNFFSPQTGKVLHTLVNIDDVADNSRIELSSNMDPLQVSIINIAHHLKHVQPHHHSGLDKVGHGINEMWILIKGCLDVTLYCELGTILLQTTMLAGDVLVTFDGSHSFKGESAVLIECKNGPFYPFDIIYDTN